MSGALQAKARSKQGDAEPLKEAPASGRRSGEPAVLREYDVEEAFAGDEALIAPPQDGSDPSFPAAGPIPPVAPPGVEEAAPAKSEPIAGPAAPLDSEARTGRSEAPEALIDEGPE